jgi:hypothetical protein
LNSWCPIVNGKSTLLDHDPSRNSFDSELRSHIFMSFNVPAHPNEVSQKN